METFIVGLHIVLCFFLILVVLLQPGKGADFGAAMGGTSTEVFGATGSVSLLSKVTGVVAGMFMMTSLGLAWVGNLDESRGGSGLSPGEMQDAAGQGSGSIESDSEGSEDGEGTPYLGGGAEGDTGESDGGTTTPGDDDDSAGDPPP
jgi:preprotein translocase subunit SecG